MKLLQRGLYFDRFGMNWAVMLLLACLVSGSHPVLVYSQGVTPESARVKAMVQKGIKFLNGYEHKPKTKSNTVDDHLGTVGGRALRALAIAKYHEVYKIPGGKSNRHVAEALQDCRAIAGNPKKLPDAEGKMYQPALALIFLCEVDPKGSKTQINAIVDYLVAQQLKCGAWSYTGFRELNHGDTSQTQYVILALWTAKNVGIYVQEDVIVKACNWLLRTQESAGGWAYQPAAPGDPYSDFGEYANHNSAPSMAAAGLGSLYITAGMLQFVNTEPVKQVVKKKSVSTILKVKDETEKLTPVTTAVDGGRVKAGLKKGDSWFSRNGLSAKCGCSVGAECCKGTDHYPYYYYYVFERYSTFRELSQRVNEPSPGWYQQGVNLLARQQAANGSWMGSGKKGQFIGPVAATSFSVFFLIRNTRKSVSKLAQTTDFQGGRGLPADTTSARFQGAKVMGSPIGGDIDSLLGLLEDVDNPKFNNLVALPPELVLSTDQKKRNAQVAKLEKIIRSGSYEARRIAVQNLGRSEGMDAVPILIFALSDPDETVMKAARDSLRFISRRIEGFGLPDKATPRERGQAQEKWRNWYRSVRPDAKFD